MTISGAHEMALSREFDAPVEAVWRAWTEPELVRRWWGPRGFTAPVADMDVRVGGTSLVCMRAPAEYGGQDLYNTWTYTLVAPPERLAFVQAFSDEHGSPVDPGSLGLPPSIPSEVPHVLTFTALGDGRTAFTVIESGYPDADIVAISRSGMEQVLDKLAEALAEDAPAPR
jgi:uncharacterized protein YndB with AHSA1/START domain